MERTATDAEFRELMLMIRGGGFDHLLKQVIDDTIQENEMVEDFNNKRSGEILRQILNAEKHTEKLIPLHHTGFKRWRWLAGVAAIIVVALLVAVLVPGKKTIPTGIAANKTNTSLQNNGVQEKKYVRLEDGSTVLLNKGSHLVYPEKFSGSNREVTLTGEGYFDIQHNADRPFIVHTGQISTTVLGTAFNVRAYPGQQSITVTVTRGKVKVSEHNKMLGIITPNESISVDVQNNLYKQETVNADRVVEWKNKYLVLDNISFEDAAILIEGKYHVKISFLKESLKACHISATFMNDETLEQVLTVLTGVLDANYKLQPNDQVIIGGNGCK